MLASPMSTQTALCTILSMMASACDPGRPILANTPASMTFLSLPYIPSGWIPLTFTAWGTASTE